MSKVLLNIPTSNSWIGGFNYFINLVTAVNGQPDSKIEFFAFKQEDKLPPPLDKIQTITPPFALKTNTSLLKRIGNKIRNEFSNKRKFQREMKERNIEIFSHGLPLNLNLGIPALAWIPDFQHKHLPHFFSDKELRRRDQFFNEIINNNGPLLLSSYDALKDLNTFYPNHNCKTFILQFVANPPDKIAEDKMSAILKQHDIDVAFFHIPNQVWAHKNHIVVIEALRILKDSGDCPLVISTGHTEDYRNPQYFKFLKDKVKEYALEDHFRFLGLVDYEVVVTLMRESVALINPSLFEGWSTTVEEAKSLGKRILLSSIPVHVEQIPERGNYFDPKKPEDLAKLMKDCLSEHSISVELAHAENAKKNLPQRTRNFASEYEKIIESIISKRVP